MQRCSFFNVGDSILKNIYITDSKNKKIYNLPQQIIIINTYQGILVWPEGLVLEKHYT